MLAGYLLYFLSIILSVIQGWLEQADSVLKTGAYIIGGPIIICIISMSFYALGYLRYLWKNGYQKEAYVGILTFALLNILAGYIWFYRSEIKHQKIRFDVFKM